MGAVHFSIDPRLIEVLKAALPLETFVETGTFEGETIQKALPFFQKIYTIEASQDYHDTVAERFGSNEKIHLLHGDSAVVMKEFIGDLCDRSVFYWMDAHWCADEKTAGAHSQCPLLRELHAISKLNIQSVIVIDDARLFFCAPPAPYEVDDWPSFDQVIRKLYLMSSDHEITVINDVIIFYPERLQASLKIFAHRHSIDWLTVLDKSRDYDSVLLQAKEKERELVSAAQKDREIHEKEQEIHEKEVEIHEKERLILQLRAELVALGESALYRTAYVLSRPGKLLKKLFAEKL